MSCPVEINNNMGAGNDRTEEDASLLIANCRAEYKTLVQTPQTQNVIDLTGSEECSQDSNQASPDLNGLQQAVMEVEAMKQQAKTCSTRADLQTLMEESCNRMKLEEASWMPQLSSQEQMDLKEDIDGMELTPIPPEMEPLEDENLGNFRLNNEYVPQLFPRKEYPRLKRKFYTMGWEETELFEELLEEALAQREVLHHGYIPRDLTIEQSEFNQVQDAAAREAVLKVTAEYFSMSVLLDEVSTSP